MQTMQFLGQTVPRIGFGTMRLPGEGVMGPPRDHDEAIRVVRRAIELGVKVIDTAWYYGPDIADQLVAEAIHPYPDDLIIITKLGGKRDDQGNWLPSVTPEALRDGMERDLRLLKLDVVPVVHLRMMSPEVDDDFEQAVETMLRMQREGKFKHLGLSNVTREQFDYVHARSPIVTVSNAYNIHDRHDDPLVARCEEEGIVYLPYFPLAAGKADKLTTLQQWASRLNVTPTQIALAWLLHRSSAIMPIPGTSSTAHLEENMAAGSIDLPSEAITALETTVQ